MSDERTKRCVRCGEVKPWSEYDARKRKDDGSVRTVQSSCKVCSRETRREHLREAYWKNPEKWRAKQRALRERRKSDPERWAEFIRRNREYQTIWRRRRGVPPTNKRVDLGGDPALPIGPFRAWLIEEQQRCGCREELARRAKVDEANIRRWLSKSKTVRLSSVDRVAHALSQPGLLAELYPLTDDELAGVA